MIKYPKQYSEFEIQSALYQKLKSKNIDTRAEVQIGNSRFDLVVYQNKNPICIIEVKKLFTNKFRHKQNRKLNAQISKYQTFNIPVFTCIGIRGIKYVYWEIIRLLKNRPPKGFLSKRNQKKLKLRDAMTKAIQYKNWLNANSLVNQNCKRP